MQPKSRMPKKNRIPKSDVPSSIGPDGATAGSRNGGAVSRRALLAALATTPAVAVAARTVGRSGGQERAYPDGTVHGYRLTAHVQNYYDAARF